MRAGLYFSLLLAMPGSLLATDPPRAPMPSAEESGTKVQGPMPTQIAPEAQIADCPTNCCASCCGASECPSSPPRVIVELSQPEVHFAAPRSCGSSCQGANGTGRGAAPSYPKVCSFLNVTVNKFRSKSVGGAATAQPFTTVVPAFATATIPIALQTTRYTTAVGAELGLAEAVRREIGETTRPSLEETVREAVRREIAQQRETAQQRESIAQRETRDSCGELRGRVDQVEKRLGQIEKQVQSIEDKLRKLP